jgi:glycerol-3-phosphate cytidylyltransferase-like family protein
VVDEAVLGFEEFDIGDVIERIKPDVIALGYDQADMKKHVQEYVDKHKLNITVVRIGKFGEDALDSSSKIRQKIVENFVR